MIKKIAILALAVSAAFSNAFAGEDCLVSFSPMADFEFTGEQVKPGVNKVVCSTDEYSASDFTKIDYGENINAGSDAGSVTITVNTGDVITKKFDIDPKGVRISIDNVEKELGGATPELTWEISNLSDMSTLNADTLKNFISALKKELKLVVVDGVEEVNVPLKISKDPKVDLGTLFPNYSFVVGTGELTITKTKVSVSAKSSSKAYGDADPKLEYTIKGNIKEADYKKLGEITLKRAEGENAGTYDITVDVEKMETDDYIIDKVENGTFTITPVDVSVTVDDLTKVYGSATKEFTYKVTGLIGKDELKDVTLSCAKCASNNLENVGDYEIAATVKEGSNPNYTVTTTPGKLTVTPKAATVTVADTAKTYGDEDPKFTFTTEGLVTATESLKDATISRAEGEKVGTYKIDVAFADGSNPNYKLTITPGTLTINPKAVTLTADNVSKKFGETDPELTYTVDGLVKLGETEDKLAGVKLTREKGENAGTYDITATVDAKANPNYVVTVAADGGVFTIIANDDKIVVTIKGHTSTGVYNGKEQTVKGFDITTESKAYDLKFVEYTGDSVVSGTNAGTYKMGLSKTDFKNTSVNYPNVEFDVTDGSLEITPKSLVITAVADSITYGDDLPTEFKWVADSLLKDDSLDNIHVSIAKTGLLDAGEYTLDFDKKAPTTTNYVVSEYVPAVFKVLKRAVTVTIRDTSKVYASADPILDSLMTVSGLRDGDVLEGVTLVREKGEFVLRTADGQDSSYKIGVSYDETKLNPNYQVKVTQGKFTIKPFAEKITVLIFGDEVIKAATGDTITVPKSFDVRLCGSICGEAPLDSGYEYSVDFVTYRDSVKIYDPDKKDSVLSVTTTSVSGVRPYLYPFNLSLDHFVNISPNFSNVVFKITNDGTLIIKKPEDIIPTKIAAIKGVAKFGLSTSGRRIQVSGSTVGNRFEVRDMQGKLVRFGFVSSANFDIPVPNAGVYMVRVGSTVQKVRVK
ncbi:MAG: hypothetical protein IKS97_02210 [Fibrobacter sp.]|nr:hypothetical protein [Fibrobacter sp.]